jgi:hypothetical protein
MHFMNHVTMYMINLDIFESTGVINHHEPIENAIQNQHNPLSGIAIAGVIL